MSDPATNSGRKITAQKNGRSEERPSSGRKRPGRAAAYRYAALQQYDEFPVCPQDTKYNSSRQNAAENLEKFSFCA
ncbi:MAG TPA: hypothetical protein VJL82_05760 [Rhizomicrobium sp.]|nr:hypothetical protein [Rhizomicrobium sp.]